MVPASLDANALMSTVQSVATDMVYQGILQETVATDAATHNISMMLML